MDIYSSKPEILSQEARPIRKRWICPDCELGEMVATGEAYMTNPPMYFHVCDKCKNSLALKGGERFPRIEYE